MLGYWIFAVCYLLTIACLVYLIDRQRRRIDAMYDDIGDLCDRNAWMRKYLKDKECEERELWAKYILKLQELENAKEG